MIFRFTYKMNGDEIMKIEKDYVDIGHAIDDFWEIPEIEETRQAGDRVVLLSIKQVEI